MKEFIVAFAWVFIFFLAFVAFEWMISLVFPVIGTFGSFLGATICTLALFVMTVVSIDNNRG